MEMLLVLALMVAVGAMVLPAMQGPMNDQRLRKAGDLIQAQWTKARLNAIKTGRMHVFQYETGSDLFQVQPWYSETDGLAPSADGNIASTTAVPNAVLGPGELPRDALLGVAGLRLPSGITFYLGETETDARLAQSGAASTSAAGVDLSAPPIVFYPDGSASNARLILTNERFCVELKLRGLTGLSRVSELLTIEEILQ